MGGARRNGGRGNGANGAGRSQRAPERKDIGGGREAMQRQVDAISARVLALQREGRHAEAAELYPQILALNPLEARVWTNFGVALRALGKPEGAVAAHRRALEIAPGAAFAINNLANALSDLGRHDEVIEHRQTLHRAAPHDADRLRDLAASLRAVGRGAEAIALIDRYAAERGLVGELQLQRALSKLMLGRWAEGFADFEGRFGGDEVSLPNDIGLARWTGGPVAGKRILVTPEQGHGDAVWSARFLPGLARMGAEVTLVAKPGLQRLMEGIEGAARVVPRPEDPAAGHDLYTPNMSLAHLVGLSDGVPPPPAGLTIPADARARARRLTSPFDGRFKVGFVWTGSTGYRANQVRSCPAVRFASLAEVPGVQLFSLYKGPEAPALAAAGLRGLAVDAGSDDRDFADTASVIAEMDLIVSTDTAVVHIAGSLGKPIWNLLHYESFWLYGQSGDATPWYPTMRLFRQPSPRAWEPVFQAVTRALAERVANGR